MTTRTVGGVTQTLSYDLQNQLETVTQSRYDADGIRVKRDDGTATTTYYPFPGYEYEFANAGGAVSTTYWLSFGGHSPKRPGQ
ncbi:MAG: hypothetical protein V3V01_16845 [Acidimicrobiales bacterium]